MKPLQDKVASQKGIIQVHVHVHLELFINNVYVYVVIKRRHETVRELLS